MTQILFLYRVQDSQSPNSILSSQVARQRTTSATANSNSGTPLPSLTGNSNTTAQVLYIYLSAAVFYPTRQLIRSNEQLFLFPGQLTE